MPLTLTMCSKLNVAVKAFKNCIKQDLFPLCHCTEAGLLSPANHVEHRYYKKCFTGYKFYSVSGMERLIVAWTSQLEYFLLN